MEVQGRWVRDVIRKMEQENIRYIDATEEAQRSWKSHINYLSDKTLFPTVRSVYMGGNIPGKVKEQMNFAGGIVSYKHLIREALDEWKGFTVSRE